MYLDLPMKITSDDSFWTGSSMWLQKLTIRFLGAWPCAYWNPESWTRHLLPVWSTTCPRPVCWLQSALCDISPFSRQRGLLTARSRIETFQKNRSELSLNRAGVCLQFRPLPKKWETKSKLPHWKEIKPTCPMRCSLNTSFIIALSWGWGNLDASPSLWGIYFFASKSRIDFFKVLLSFVFFPA